MTAGRLWTARVTCWLATASLLVSSTMKFVLPRGDRLRTRRLPLAA